MLYFDKLTSFYCSLYEADLCYRHLLERQQKCAKNNRQLTEKLCCNRAAQNDNTTNARSIAAEEPNQDGLMRLFAMIDAM